MRYFLLRDDQAASFTQKEKLLYSLATAFLLSLYLPHIPAITNILLGGLALFSFFYHNFREKFRLLRSRQCC